MTAKHTPLTIKDAQLVAVLPDGWRIQFVRWREKLMAVAIHPNYLPRSHVLDGRPMRPFAYWKEVEV